MYDSEIDIIKGCLRNDLTAQKKLYETFSGKMMGVCMRYAKTREEAEDILQDGFFKVFCSLNQYDGRGAFGGWIRKIMVNTALQHIRKEKGKVIMVGGVENYDRPSDLSTNIESQFEVNELMKMIQKLPTGYQTVFNMHVIDGYSHKEIAEQLGITVGSSKSQLSKAKSALKEMLGKKKEIEQSLADKKNYGRI